MNKLIKIIEPTPRVCKGQNQPKYPPSGNKFIKDVSLVINNSNADSLTIDGYIVNNENTITRIIFKREIEFINNDLNLRGLKLEDLWRNDYVSQIKDLYKTLAKTLSCGIDFIFLPVNNSENELYLIISEYPFERVNGGVLSFNKYAERIKYFRNRSFPVTKPLVVSNSYLECYLANELKKDPFPGDIDLIIFKNDSVKSVVEFKTHNLRSDIREESFDKYKDKDYRRIDVLCSLTKALKLKFYFFVIWGDFHSNVKIQKISECGELMEEFLVPKNSNNIASILLSEDKSI